MHLFELIPPQTDRIKQKKKSKRSTAAKTSQLQMKEISKCSNNALCFRIARGPLRSVFIFVLIGLAFLNARTPIKVGLLSKNEKQQAIETGQEPKLADDCLLVYLDVGANIGVHTRFLFEPEKYPRTKAIPTVFNPNFGSPPDRDNRDICSFGFEPNPIHKKRHQELEQVYAKMGWRYKFIGAGVGDHDTNMTFWHPRTEYDLGHQEWGFGLTKPSNANDAVAEVVPIIAFHKWVQKHIIGRRLPHTVYGNYSDTILQNGKVVMKMDIEGAEYIVLPSMLFSGVFCKAIDYGFGEIHPHFAASFNRKVSDTGKGDVNFGPQASPNTWYDGLMKQAFKSLLPEDCKAVFFDFDDESYLHDGMPWPDQDQKPSPET
jgi:Methyltransferase FkbM domain